MQPPLHSWREDLSAAFVRGLAYVCGAVALSIAAAHVFQSRPAPSVDQPAVKPAWVAIEKPFPAFALDIPEAAGAPARYAILHNEKGGRKDVLSLGESDSAEPYLQVEIYRPGEEIDPFAEPSAGIAADAAALAPVNLLVSPEPLASKFGPLTILTFDTSRGVARHCLAFVRAFDDPQLQISGWFCRGGTPVRRATLACALDRLMLLSTGSEPKIGALFAKAELHRNFCGERDPILASTPSFKLLWKAARTRPEPRRIGR
jgi:hypothetical protein